MKNLHSLAPKSLLGRRRRFFFLTLAVAFGFFIMTLTTGMTEGLLQAVRDKGAFYFSGNINVQAMTSGGVFTNIDQKLLSAAVKSSLPGAVYGFRTIDYTAEAQLFYHGASVRQRRLIGVDWQSERDEVKSLYFSQGTAPQNEGGDAILISDTAAKRLGAKLGDTLTVMARGNKGRNTAPFVIRGIFRDSSLFGYAAYISREGLNDLLALPEDYATDLSVYLPRGLAEHDSAARLRDRIAQDLPAFPLVLSRQQKETFSSQSWQGIKYMVFDLDAHLSDIKTALDAIQTVCYVILAVFLFIVLIGISNTYRVVVYQRSSEIGTMRALGLSKKGAVLVLVEEAGILAAFASLLGLAFGSAVLWLLSCFDLSSKRSLDMFLLRGHLAWALDGRIVLLIFVIVCLTTLMAAWLPARKAASIEPVEAMRDEE